MPYDFKRAYTVRLTCGAEFTMVIMSADDDPLSIAQGIFVGRVVWVR